MATKSIGAFCAGVLSCLFPVQSVHAVPLVGGLTDYYTSFTGTLSSIQVDVGQGLQDTGVISFMLDPGAPPRQKLFSFNFDTMTASAKIDFLIDFDLLHQMGLSPIPIHIEESGPIVSSPPDLPVGPGQSLAFEALLVGGGTVLSGPFTGFTYSNLNDTKVEKTVNVAPGGQYHQKINGGGNVTIDAKINLISTTGTGVFEIAAVPEPASWALMIAGFGLAGAALRSSRVRVGTAPQFI